MEKKHYYVHGDQSEGNASEFYCTMCDLFVGKSHFAQRHGDKVEADHLKRRASSLLYVRRMVQQTKGAWGYCRATDAINLFDGWTK